MNVKESNETKAPRIFLFGQLILPSQPSSQSCSGDTNSSEGSLTYKDHKESDLCLETGHCKVFIESENVGRTLDLSIFGSYEELHEKLANMFGIEISDSLSSSVFYRDAAGAIKHIGDEPFSEFLKTARRLTILTDSDSGSENLGR